MPLLAPSEQAKLRMLRSALPCFVVNESRRVLVTAKGAVQYFEVPSSGEAGGTWKQALNFWRGIKESAARNSP